MQLKTEAKILAGGLALLLSSAFFAICLTLPGVSSKLQSIGNLNLLTYGCTLILFCLSFLACYGVITAGKGQLLSILKHTGVKYAATLLMFGGSLIFLYVCFIMEGNIAGGVTYKFMWHNIPVALLVILLLIENICFFNFLYHNKSLVLPDTILYLIYAGLTILIGYVFYTPNIFGRYLRGDSAHGHAYFNSIYNVYHGTAYTETTTSIYGHYGLFYKLPMKLMGGNYADFLLINAILSAACFLCMFLTLHLLVKNRLLRFMGCITMLLPVLSMRGGYYWQLWPHRILFASVMLLFGAWCLVYHKMNLRTCLFGYLISCLGVVWNTESGMFCAAAWAALWILKTFCKKNAGILTLLKSIIFHLAAIVLCFFGAFGIVNLYNILQHSPANSLQEFLFPLISSSYMTDLLMMELPLYPSAYMLTIILFLMGVAWGISKMALFQKNHVAGFQILPCYSFFLGILSLGQLTYFINRPAYHNLDICYLPVILLMCIFARTGLPLLRRFKPEKLPQFSFGELWKMGLSAMILAVFLTLSTGTVVQFGYNMDVKKNYHNTEELQPLLDSMAAKVPPHTYGFGVSISDLYSMLGWSTNCYTLDYTDLSLRPFIADCVENDMKEKDIPGFFTAADSLASMSKYTTDHNKWIYDNYEVKEEFPYGDTTFQYYVKKTAP